MRPAWLGFILVLMVTLALGGCRNDDDDPVTIDAADAGTTVDLRPADVLVVELEGNPTTGYSWEVETIDTAVLELVGEPEFEPDSDAVGAGGMVTLRVNAVDAGESPLKLIYHRPFEQGVEPLETFEVRVVVE